MSKEPPGGAASANIEPGHLLLGILREDKQFASTVLKVGFSDSEELRQELLNPGAEKRSMHPSGPRTWRLDSYARTTRLRRAF